MFLIPTNTQPIPDKNKENTMAEKTVEEKVKEIIVEQLGVNPEQVTTTAKFIEDLGPIPWTPSSS